jgi:exodeoxyribonuclease-3
MDVHNPRERKSHVCYHQDARDAFRACCDWGFVDVFRKHHPEPGHYTFFDYRRADAVERGLGWRIDYILASPALAEKSVDAYIDLEPRRAEKPSDHTFLVAEFAL